MKLKILKNFAQLNTAIILLLIIFGFSIIGTIIEQNEQKEYYINLYSQIYLFKNIPFSNLILFTGIDHIYQTWWFLGLLLLFGFCLMSCTFTQQLPYLKYVKQLLFKFYITDLKKQEHFIIYNSIYFFKSLLKLKKKKYIVNQQKKYTYLYRGILGRFAPIIVHLSILFILLGNLIAALGNINSQELIAKGEIFQVQNIISKGIFSNLANNTFRVNNFWINYEEKKVKQFYSDLSILDEKGYEIKRKTISVNNPLKYKELTIYQTDWKINAIRINNEDKVYEFPLLEYENLKNTWVTWLPKNSQDGFILIVNNLNGDYLVYEKQKFVGYINFNEEFIFSNKLVFTELVTQTGLQIKSDISIFLIYFGFFFLMISSLISYFSFNQFWLLKQKNYIILSANTNRDKLDLKLQFLTLILPYNTRKKIT